MKLTPTLSALLASLALPLHGQEKAAPEPSTAKTSSTAAVTIVNGNVVVTTDVNGKKETKTFDLNKTGGRLSLPELVNGKSNPADQAEKTVTWLGVATQRADDNVVAQLPIAKGTGLAINSVAPESPAAKAGLEENDVLNRFDDQLLINPEQLETLVLTKAAGESVVLSYFRKGKELKTTATLGSHLASLPGSEIPELERLIDEMKKRPSLGFPSFLKTYVVTREGRATQVPGADTSIDELAKDIMERLERAGVGKEARSAVEKALRPSPKPAEEK